MSNSQISNSELDLLDNILDDTLDDTWIQNI